MWRFISAYWLSYLATNLLIIAFIISITFNQEIGIDLNDGMTMLVIKIVLGLFLAIFIINIGLFIAISIPLFLILQKYFKLNFLYILSWSTAIGLANATLLYFYVVKSFVPFYIISIFFTVIGAITGLIFWAIYKWLTKPRIDNAIFIR
ncbi:hypothetical protein [Bartonella sp. HY761]|uniref:hypothetical protein n=1 Tax=Bartonella sp. HY761 TaxID=2979330 RepID=UPI0021E33CCF|nr:hypothetical protein [Bartonella sp. HY761]UXN07958.1 hypothetical protein N6A79_15235 [Bartonella sp. HY761]